MKKASVRPFAFSDFSKFWLSDIISAFGTQLTTLALPLTAILILNATPVQLGIIGFLRLLPALLLNLFVGVWIDRLPRRPVLIATNLGLGFSYGSIPLAYAIGFLSIEFLYLAVFLGGCFGVVFYVAYQAFLPDLVRKEDLTGANSKLEATNSIATIVGPGLGGWLVQFFSAPLVIVFDAGSYFVSAFLLSFIRQALVPARLQGRASASTRFIAIGVGSVGALLGGYLGDVIGLQPALLVGAVISLMACLWIFFSPLRSVASQASLLNEASKL